MGLFATILEKLGLGKKEEAKAEGAKPAAKPPAYAQSAPPPSVSTFTPAVPAKPAPISEVDVVKKLEQMAVGTNLNWKVSIVDLLKLLGIDSSLQARIELAKELGCPPDMMEDSARMNVWLHKTVLRKIAENGGNIPKELLD